MNLTTKLTLAFSLGLALLGIAYAQTAKPSPPQASTGTTNGRYQIVTSPVTARNTFMLDTQTGKVWQFTQFTDLVDDPTVWLFQPRIDSDQEMARFVQTHIVKKTP